MNKEGEPRLVVRRGVVVFGVCKGQAAGHEVLRERPPADAFEAARAIAEPDDDGALVQPVGPDQVGVAVQIQVLRKERAGRSAKVLEMKPRRRARQSELNLDAA